MALRKAYWESWIYGPCCIGLKEVIVVRLFDEGQATDLFFLSLQKELFWL